MSENENVKKTISVPPDLHRRIIEQAKATGFDSADEYAIFVLEEVLKPEAEDATSDEDDAEVKKRLRSLGYME